MADIIIPIVLSMLLGPGVGQLYNKEYKKGGYLVGVSLVVLFGACYWFGRAAMPYLPDITAIDPSQMQPLMRQAADRVVAEHGGIFYTYQALLVALWLYSIVDAYRGGVRRHNERLSNPQPKEKAS